MGFLAMLPVMSSAQNKIGYSYDAAGNRVKREIVMSYQQAMSKQQTFPIEEPSFSDNLQGHSVKIYLVGGAVGGILGSLSGSWIGTSTVDWIYGR